MSRASVLFVGGPLHGTLASIPEPLPPIYRVPVLAPRDGPMPYSTREYRLDTYLASSTRCSPVYVDVQTINERGPAAVAALAGEWLTA